MECPICHLVYATKAVGKGYRADCRQGNQHCVHDAIQGTAKNNDGDWFDVILIAHNPAKNTYKVFDLSEHSIWTSKWFRTVEESEAVQKQVDAQLTEGH